MKIVKSEPAPFAEVVLVCSKCAAKLGRGHKGKTELRVEIKRALKDYGLSKQVRVVDTTCLDLCPKDGQTVATIERLSRGELLVAAPGANGEALVKLLFGSKRGLAETTASGSEHLPPIARRGGQVVIAG